MRFVKTFPLLLSLGAALGSASAWALPSDRDQPIRVQADSANWTTSKVWPSIAVEW